MSHIIATDKNFKQEVLEEEKPVLVDFWAPWCRPCLILSPMIEELEEELEGKVLVAKLNVDENRETAMRYRIQGIPTVLVFKDGKLRQRLVGVRSKQAYRKALEQ
ncbi:MAG: thioredoxin [Patescibacteria group bacterium]